MTVKSIFKLCLFSLFFTAARAHQPEIICLHLIDGWDGRPVAGVIVKIDTITFTSDEQGLLEIGVIPVSQVITLYRPGYYQLVLDTRSIRSGQVIRIFPVIESDTIMVAGARLGFSELEIASSRKRLNAETYHAQNSLGDLLTTENGIFIKSYGGPESTQSIAMRGLGAEQTLILLDGIPVNSGQTGVVDLQRYRAFFFDELEIYRGGFSTLAGSGAIGGLVNMSSKIKPAGVTIGYEHRSFGQQQVNFSLNTQLGISHHDLRFGSDQGPNHYDFILDHQRGKRLNSDYRYTNFSYHGNIALDSGGQVDFGYLFGKYDNGSPRAITTVDGYQGQARMAEENWIAQAGWDQKWSRDLLLRTQLYLHRNWQDYRNADILVASNHYNQGAGGMFKLTGRLTSDIWLYTGLDLELTDVRSSETGNHDRRRFAVYGLGNWLIWQKNSMNATLNLALREEIYSDFGMIFLPRGGVDIQLGDWQVYLSLGRNFRAPTLNELYWQPGGNSDLQPEKSFCFETGISHDFKFNGDWHISAGYYDIRVGQMIKWYPGDNGVWRAQNIEKVRSNGVELAVDVSSLFNFVTLYASYKYGLAVKYSSEIPRDPTVGNRLPYIPRSEFSGRLVLEYQSIEAGLEISYNSFRFIRIDNDPEEYLPEFWIANIFAGYRFTAWDWNCTVYGRVNNLKRVEYQLITGYPLPIQTWIFGVKFDLAQNIFE